MDNRCRLADERERQRQAAQRVRGLADQLGPRYSSDRARLDRFEIYHPGQQRALDLLRETMAGWPDALREGRGLVLIGPPGVGKDHLAAACAYAAAGRHGLNCGWVSGLDLAGGLRDLMGSKRETEGGLLARYAAPDVLVLSDPIPPAGEVSAFVQGWLLRLVDARYRALRSTWLSVNAASPEDAAVRLGTPTFDRIREGALVVQCYWPSYRQRVGAPS